MSAVVAGGAFGALCRYMVVTGCQQFLAVRFPLGTLLVNTTGSFLAGFLLAVLVGRWAGSEYLRLFVFTGFLGAYTTFSSFAAESLMLFEEQQWFKLLANIVLNNLLALLLVFWGWHTAKALMTQ